MNSPKKSSMFVTEDGRNVLLTFILVASLFALWGFCNGLIDVMDKHFQEELHLSLSQSAWVQFAHYLGYFLMAMPAGWLATKLGYKGGIITGLLMVAVGGLWFIPASNIAQFWAFLLGVCFIAAGLTFLETIANPYSTVLGAPKYAATRINLAQSCNGLALLGGPIVGGMFFYSKDAAGVSTGADRLWIPYAAVAGVVIVLAIIFIFAPMPDIKADDDYNLDDKANPDPVVVAGTSRTAALWWIWINVVVLAMSIGMIANAITTIFASNLSHPQNVFILISVSISIIGGLILLSKKRTITDHSIWLRPHFTASTIAQFLYVAAQAGIWSFFINYMTSQTPSISPALQSYMRPEWLHTNAVGHVGLSDKGAAFLASVGFFCFLAGRFSGTGILGKFSAHRTLGLYGLVSAILCVLVFLKLGWISVICVFLTYFFMSIMFPTIFALGIFGLGGGAKKASSFLVMAIMGGAIVPKFMGSIADHYDLSRAFIVPIFCFGFIAVYGYFWPKFSGAPGLDGVPKLAGH